VDYLVAEQRSADKRDGDSGGECGKKNVIIETDAEPRRPPYGGRT